MIEAGLGGITDATNVFAAQQLFLAVITALGLEHQAALGSCLIWKLASFWKAFMWQKIDLNKAVYGF